MKFQIDVEDMPTEIEARDLKSALQIAHQHITVIVEREERDYIG
jgi:hypothetical protein